MHRGTSKPGVSGTTITGPEPVAGRPVWSGGNRALEVRFCGRGPEASREEVVRSVVGDEHQLSWARQIHSNRVLAARPGPCGEGDALVTRRPGLALAIATADCVPVLLGDESRVAAVHAGWRGIAGGIVSETLGALGDPHLLAAWVGPAIGPCCYEVDPEVAARVAAASSAETVYETDGKPKLDLPLAVTRQLLGGGVHAVHRLDRCTRCHPRELWSYRRDGGGAGRNLAIVWLR